MKFWIPESAASHGMLLVACCLTVTLFAGCSAGSERPSGKVSGRITFEGEPVTSGVVNLMATARGAGASANLGEDGKYQITEPVETGQYKVVFTPAPPPPPRPEDGPPKPTKPPANIPEKYRSESTTDLSTVVEEGENALDFNLTK